MTAKSQNSLKEKNGRLKLHKYTKLHCVRLGDGLGSRGLADPRTSHFTQTDRNMTDVSIKAACRGGEEGHRFFSVSVSPRSPHHATF